MLALVSPEKIQLPAGSVVRLPATWQEYQSLCDRRGDGSLPRLKYRNGIGAFDDIRSIKNAIA